MSRELTDEEILEMIDDLILSQNRNCYLSLQQKHRLRRELFFAVRKMDVLQELLEDPEVTEIMVNGWQCIFVEKFGRIQKYDKKFTSEEKLYDVIQQIAARCNRMINASHPIMDARLENGDRVSAVIAPVALNGPILTIRRFSEKPVTLSRLVQWGSLSREAAEYLITLVRGKYSILIGGSTGSGKSTLLGALSGYIPREERIITIEDNAELQIQGIENLVRLEVKTANMEGNQEITIRDLIKTSLRMRPSRVIVGEVRQEESFDLIQCCNTGHMGSMSTLHANSTRDMVSRLEMMVLTGMDIPLEAIRKQIAAGFDIFIHIGRMGDGSRKILEIAEVTGYVQGEVRMQPLFQLKEQLIQVGELQDNERFCKAEEVYENRL
ncbi:MAG: CpaF family protein [Lachnospiraceae bacterium]